MATFTYTASFEATEASKPRVTTFQAGDGYQQRVGFGLHRDGKEWQLQFLMRRCDVLPTRRQRIQVQRHTE
jgi:phage-related protein